MNEKLKEKIKESIFAVLPITLIVLFVCLFITPVSSELLLLFLVGAILLIVGMGFFSLGADTSMSLIGERVGASLSKSKKIWLIALVSFIVGAITTIAEPDLQVLATQINDIPSVVLIGTVGIGVGIFLMISMLRIVFNIKLSKLLVLLYIFVFILSFFVPGDFLPLAFDSGGVTTGPITVPFIIALGVGAASIRDDKNSESDSFGLVALSSIGPIVTVMILGLVFKISNTVYEPMQIASFDTSRDVGRAFLSAVPEYCIDVLKSLSPIIIFFVLYNLIILKLPKPELKKVGFGLIYTFIGLVVFLVGVHIGFLPVGNNIGLAMMQDTSKFLISLIIAIIGYFVVKAEPAVQILTKQVSTITDGMVSEKIMLQTLSIGMGIALVISFLRAAFGIPIVCILIPGYILALGLSFFSPEMFVGIAYDSGGVTSRTNDSKLFTSSYNWHMRSISEEPILML